MDTIPVVSLNEASHSNNHEPSLLTTIQPNCDSHDVKFSKLSLPPQEEALPLPQQQQEQVESVDALVFDDPQQQDSMHAPAFETPQEEQMKLVERKPVLFLEADEQNARLGKVRDSLLVDAEEKKLSLGDFRNLALTDIDEALRLPERDELEELVKRSSHAGKRNLEEPNNAGGERGRLRIHNVGGSLTFLLQIAVLAWGIRQLRSVLAKRRQKQAPRINTMPFRPSDPPLFSNLSALAVKKLVDTSPTSYLLIDVRFPEAVQANPFPLKSTVNIPEAEVRVTFQLTEAEWATRFPCIRRPERSELLVFLSTKGRRAQRAAITATELGYNGCCVLSGGILAFQVLCRDGDQYQPAVLSKDTVAVLLRNMKQKRSENSTSPQPYLVDVRRHDERVLYGHIYGSVHVAVNEWPKALVMEPLDWERNHGCPKFAKEDLIILYCRTNNRSSWAAQVAHDAGVNRCFVCKGGVLGWRLDANVLPYDGYALGDPPPEPLKFEIEAVNFEAAEQELQQLELH